MSSKSLRVKDIGKEAEDNVPVTFVGFRLLAEK